MIGRTSSRSLPLSSNDAVLWMKRASTLRPTPSFGVEEQVQSPPPIIAGCILVQCANHIPCVTHIVDISGPDAMLIVGCKRRCCVSPQISQRTRHGINHASVLKTKAAVERISRLGTHRKDVSCRGRQHGRLDKTAGDALPTMRGFDQDHAESNGCVSCWTLQPHAQNTPLKNSAALFTLRCRISSHRLRDMGRYVLAAEKEGPLRLLVVAEFRVR